MPCAWRGLYPIREGRRQSGSAHTAILSFSMTRCGGTKPRIRRKFTVCFRPQNRMPGYIFCGAEILYLFFNRRSCADEPFSARVERVVIDTMASANKVTGVYDVPRIRMTHFIAPRGIDLSHSGYTVMDGRYYSFLSIKGNGYPPRVRAGWMSSLINGIDVDIHLRRENSSKTIDKVTRRIRLNRTKLKDMQDTSTDYEELTNSIQAGYYIKYGIANSNGSKPMQKR